MIRRAPRGASIAFLAAPPLAAAGRRRPLRPFIGGVLLGVVIAAILLGGL